MRTAPGAPCVRPAAPPPWPPEPVAAVAPPATIVREFARQAEPGGERPMLWSREREGWLAWRWRDVERQAVVVAAGLVGAGVLPGDRVVLLSGDRAEAVTCLLAVLMAGAVPVPVDPTLPAGAAQAIVRRSGAGLAIAADEATAARLHLTDTLSRIIRLDGQVARWSSGAPGAHHQELLRRVSRLRPGDAAAELWGPDEPLVVTHAELVAAAAARVAGLGLGPRDVVLSLLPPGRVVERTLAAALAITAGARLCLGRLTAPCVVDVRVVRPTVVLATTGALEALRSVVTAPGRLGRLEGAVLRCATGVAESGSPLGGRLRLTRRLALHGLRRELGGGRLRLVLSADGPPSGALQAFHVAVGVPVIAGCLDPPRPAERPG